MHVCGSHKRWVKNEKVKNLFWILFSNNKSNKEKYFNWNQSNISVLYAFGYCYFPVITCICHKKKKKTEKEEIKPVLQYKYLIAGIYLFLFFISRRNKSIITNTWNIFKYYYASVNVKLFKIIEKIWNHLLI